MAETIGLTAIFDISDFNRGKEQYLSGLTVMDKSTNSAASVLTGQFVGLGQGVLKFGAIAGGVALAGVTALAGGLVYLGTQALESYAKYERMSLSITNLVARELSQGQESITQKQVLAQLTKKEADELAGLNLKIQEEGLERQSQLAKIQEQKQRIIELTAAYGENGLNVQTAKAKLAEMEFELTKSDTATAKYTARINELNAKNGQLITVTEKVRTGQMSMADAMAQAGPKAKELLDWISKLAIQSPFNQEGIALAFKTAMTYGFTTEQAQRLTQAEVDYAAATGASVDAANMIALALGQMQAKGKVSGQELIQLTNAGIGTNAILEKMGFTIDDVSKGLVDSDKFIEAVIGDMEVFKGAGAAQANTFSGLLSSLQELKDVGLREFFTGTFQAIQPYLASFVGTLTDPATFDALRLYGSLLGDTIVSGLQKISGLIGAFKQGGTTGLISALGLTPQTIDLISKITTSLTSLGNSIMSVLMPAFTNLASGGAIALLNQAIEFLNQHFYEFQGALIGIGAVLASSAIAAILAGIATAIGALLSPIGLLIAGAALLGAAWVGNWGNIQGVFAQFVAFWQAQWPVIQAVALTAWQVLQSIWAGIVAAITPAFQSIQQAFANITAAMAAAGISWGDVGNAFILAISAIALTIGAIVVSLISIIASLVSGFAAAFATATTYWQSFSVALTAILSGLMTFFYGFYQQVYGLFTGNFSMVLSGWVNMWNGAIQTVLGLCNLIVTTISAMVSSAMAFFTTFGSSLTAFWQNLYMTLVGGSIIPDMANAIVQVFSIMMTTITTLLSTAAQPIVDIFNTIASTIQGLLGNLFGGVGSVTLDLTTLTTTLPQAIINNITLVSQLLSNLTNINTLIMSLLPTSLQTFLDISIDVFSQVISFANQFYGILSQIYNAIANVISIMIQLGSTAQNVFPKLAEAAQTAVSAFNSLSSAVSSVNSKLGETKSKIDSIKSSVDKLTDAFKELASAAQSAADATGNVSAPGGGGGGAAAGLGFSRGLGFATGLGSENVNGLLNLGYKIPAGFSGDTFGPMYAQSGEEMLISPRGTSIEDLIFRRLEGLNISQQRQSPTINVYTGDINNGMDLSMLENFIQTTVADSFG